MLLDLITPTLDDDTSRELLRIDEGPDLPWADLPSPPTPAGIDQFPQEPSRKIVARKYIRDAKKWVDDSDGVRIEYEPLDGIWAIVDGRWKSVTQATVTSQTGYQFSEEVQIGATNTTTFSVGLSISVGAKILSVVDIGVKLSAMFGVSQTISILRTEKKQFDFKGTEAVPRLTGCAWQADFEYTLFMNRCKVIINGGNPILRKNVSYTMPSTPNRFSMTQYPPAA